MSPFAIANAMSTNGLAVYISVAVCALIWAIIAIVNKTYLRTAHTVRVSFNSLCLIVFMILLILQSLNIVDPSQNLVPSLFGLTLLTVNLVINFTVFARIELKRRKQKAKRYKVGNIDAIIAQ